MLDKDEMQVTNEQVEQITTDVRFQQLKYDQEKSNVFTVVGQTHKEHWHSAFIKWLLEPNSSLQLGHYALARLLNLYLHKNKETDFTLQELYSYDLDAVRFETEKTFFDNGKKRAIDVYGESDRLIIVIENKVKATENKNNTEIGQTVDYYNYAEKIKNPGQRTFYFFITPNPKQKASHEAYVQITYQEMYDSIIAKCIQHPQLNKDGRYLLDQYASNLREPVNNSPMALVHIDICRELYNAYPECFDEIYKAVENPYKYNSATEPACVFYNRYKSVLDEIFLSLDEYGQAPKSMLHRAGEKRVTINDLYKAGKLADGESLVMKYDNVTYHAVCKYEKREDECYMVVLDNNKSFYRNKEGEIIGYYSSSSRAGMDAINLYRKQIGGNPVMSLRGSEYWKTLDGKSINDLIDEMKELKED